MRRRRAAQGEPGTNDPPYCQTFRGQAFPGQDFPGQPSQAKPSEATASQQNPRPRISAPPPRPTATPMRQTGASGLTIPGVSQFTARARRANQSFARQSPPMKIFPFSDRSTYLYKSRHPVSKRGVGHRHERWGGMRWTRQRRARDCDRRAVFRERSCSAQTNCASVYGKPCGPDTRCWCQALRRSSSSTGFGETFNPHSTVTRRVRRRGERGISRKAIAQGMPDCSVCTCFARVRFFAHFCTRDRGCRTASGIPCTLLVRVVICKIRTHRAAGKCSHRLAALSSIQRHQ